MVYLGQDKDKDKNKGGHLVIPPQKDPNPLSSR